MPSLLTRSKSLRLLTGGRRVHREELPNSIPLPGASQPDLDRFKSATPVPSSQRALEAPEMPTRPSTSSGPGERAVQYQKRAPPAPSVFSEDRYLVFSSPTDSSATSAILHPVPALPTEAQPIQEQDVIGVALSSPSTPALPNWTPPPATPGDQTPPATMNQYGNVSSVTLGSTQDPMKPKISRWKSFFRKNQSPAQPAAKEKQNFYQLNQQSSQQSGPRADSHHETSPVSETGPRRGESSANVSPTGYDPEIRGSRKTSNATAEAKLEPKSDVQARQRAATVGLDRVHPKYNIKRSSTTPANPSVPSLLNVDIPDIQMERYSVMFRGVLQPGETTRTSLLERRQQNAEKVTPLNQLTAKSEDKASRVLRRRASSPTVSSSPPARIAVFQPSQEPASVATPTFRSRSKTVPAKSISQTFSPSDAATPSADISKPVETSEPPEAPKPSAPATMPRKDSAHPYMKPERSESRERTRTPPSGKSSDKVSQSREGSPARSRLGRSMSVYKEKEALRAQIEAQEPEWELLPKPAQPAAAPRETSTPPPRNPRRQESQREPRVNVAIALATQSSSSSFNSLSPRESASPIEASSPLKNLEHLLSTPASAARVEKVQQVNIQRKNSERRPQKVDQTATVGIARSVSVSKANRPRTITRRGTDTGTPERLVEHSALTPTLVEIGNRKSHRVQLVEA